MIIKTTDGKFVELNQDDLQEFIEEVIRRRGSNSSGKTETLSKLLAEVPVSNTLLKAVKNNRIFNGDDAANIYRNCDLLKEMEEQDSIQASILFAELQAKEQLVAIHTRAFILKHQLAESLDEELKEQKTINENIRNSYKALKESKNELLRKCADLATRLAQAKDLNNDLNKKVQDNFRLVDLLREHMVTVYDSLSDTPKKKKTKEYFLELFMGLKQVCVEITNK